MTTSDSRHGSLNPWLRWAVVLLALAVMYGIEWSRNRADRQAVEQAQQRTSEQEPRRDTATSESSAASPIATPKTAGSKAATSSDPLVVRNVTLRDQDGETIYRCDVDLRPTLERIVAGKKLRFSHDGTTFQNRERRLPQKPPGYYREWVVPTPGESGPGPQRLVTGEDGDVWYTADHYLSFRRVPYKLPALESATDR